MKVTSAEANKMIKVINTKIDTLEAKERVSCTYTLATTEKPGEGNIPKYDFEDTQEQLADLQNDLVLLKHLINVFNTTTIISSTALYTPPEVTTIDEILVVLPIWNTELNKLKVMKNRLKQRRIGSCNGLVEYEYTNYDPLDAEIRYDGLQQKIIYFQTELDKINNSVTFEIPDRFQIYMS